MMLNFHTVCTTKSQVGLDPDQVITSVYSYSKLKIQKVEAPMAYILVVGELPLLYLRLYMINRTCPSLEDLFPQFHTSHPFIR
jgi:hypothetical protein